MKLERVIQDNLQLKLRIQSSKYEIQVNAAVSIDLFVTREINVYMLMIIKSI